MIIVGLSDKRTLVARAQGICPHCRQETAQRLYRLLRRLTVFFVPLFAVSRRYQLDCASCAQQYLFPKPENTRVESLYLTQTIEHRPATS